MKKIYNAPEMLALSFETSDIITGSEGMVLGTFNGGMILGESDFGEFNETGF